MSYQPGKHLIATLHQPAKQNSINTYASFRTLVEALIEQYQLR